MLPSTTRATSFLPFRAVLALRRISCTEGKESALSFESTLLAPNWLVTVAQACFMSTS